MGTLKLRFCRLFMFLGDLGDGELDAPPHRIDALGSHVHAVAQMPREFFGLCASPTARPRRPAPSVASRQRHNRMIAFAENAARASGVLERVIGGWQASVSSFW